MVHNTSPMTAQSGASPLVLHAPPSSPPPPGHVPHFSGHPSATESITVHHMASSPAQSAPSVQVEDEEPSSSTVVVDVEVVVDELVGTVASSPSQGTLHMLGHPWLTLGAEHQLSNPAHSAGSLPRPLHSPSPELCPPSPSLYTQFPHK